MGYLCAGTFTILALLVSCACDNRRPIYNIAHMVNSIKQIRWYLYFGANMMEFDIQFYANGSVNKVYHGTPCDFLRICEYSANLQEYLKYLRNLTDPSTPNNYADQMIMQMFDLKLNEGINLIEAGKDIARHVLDYLWSEDGQRKQEVRVIIYIDSVKYNDTIKAFIEEFKRKGKESRLRDVGFDGGSGNIEDIRKMFDSLGVKNNTWIGDGSTNYFSAFISDKRLREEIKVRDGPTPFMEKVYHWTIDSKWRMKRSLELKVDGFITNFPSLLVKVVQDEFNDTCRLATPDDDPFARYDG